MKRCRHRNTCDTDRDGYPCSMRNTLLHRRWCWDCHAHIGLGPSNDTSTEVRAEIHAVEVEAAHLAHFTGEEAEDWPWSDCPFVDDDGRQCWRCEGEDLAKIIKTHKEPGDES